MSLTGTFRTWHDVRLEPVMHSKADIGRDGRFNEKSKRRRSLSDVLLRRVYTALE